MNQSPAFQFYVDNFVQGTCDMDCDEVGAYIRLLCYQWSNGAIPKEKGRLLRVAGGPVSDHVIAKFREDPDGMLRNHRMEKERAKQLEYRQKQAAFGKTGGRPKKGSLSKPFSVQKGLPKGSQSSPSPSPSPSSLSGTDSESSTPKGVAAVAAVSEHQAFIKGWVENFRSKWGVDYKVEGGRDGKAVSALLKMGILRIDLLEIAKKAWESDSWACKQAVEIHGFHHQFNKINVEVNNGSGSKVHQGSNRKQSSSEVRNASVIGSGDVRKRIEQEQRELEAGTNLPPGLGPRKP